MKIRTLVEIHESLERIEANLPSSVDSENLSYTAGQPFLVEWYRVALRYRMAELTRAALRELECGRILSAVVLTRAVVETTASLWHLHLKIAAARQSGGGEKLTEYLKRAVLGNRTIQTWPDPINVLTVIDKMDESVAGLRHQYDLLCEFAHPNHDGVVGLFSKLDVENRRSDFGCRCRTTGYPEILVVMNLSVALTLFINRYERIADLMPVFIKV